MGGSVFPLGPKNQIFVREVLSLRKFLFAKIPLFSHVYLQFLEQEGFHATPLPHFGAYIGKICLSGLVN